MKTLIRLELKKNNINTYILADIIIAITMIGFLFLFAYAPLIEPNDKDMAIFAGYDNLISLFCVFILQKLQYKSYKSAEEGSDKYASGSEVMS